LCVCVFSNNKHYYKTISHFSLFVWNPKWLILVLYWIVPRIRLRFTTIRGTRACVSARKVNSPLLDIYTLVKRITTYNIIGCNNHFLIRIHVRRKHFGKLFSQTKCNTWILINFTLTFYDTHMKQRYFSKIDTVKILNS
jgi:hypothetical protein